MQESLQRTAWGSHSRFSCITAGAKLPQRYRVTLSAGESCAFAFVTVMQENP
jgi:hypothetical protein